MDKNKVKKCHEFDDVFQTRYSTETPGALAIFTATSADGYSEKQGSAKLEKRSRKTDCFASLVASLRASVVRMTKNIFKTGSFHIIFKIKNLLFFK